MANTNQVRNYKTGRWSQQEHMLFLLAIGEFGKDWKEVHKMLPNRTLTQIRSHAQKYYEKEKTNVKLKKTPQLYYALANDKLFKDYFQFLNIIRTFPHALYFASIQQRYKQQRNLNQQNAKGPEEPQQNTSRIRIE